MNSRTWKRFEQTVAEMFFTHRRLMKGTDEKSDIGDDNYPLCLDCKLRAQWSIVAWWKELEVFSRPAGKIPVLVVRRSGKRKAYAFIDYLQFEDILREHRPYDGLFYVHSPGPSGKWQVEASYEQARKQVEKENAIPAVALERTGGPLLLCLDPQHLASLLKGCGIIGQEDI